MPFLHHNYVILDTVVDSQASIDFDYVATNVCFDVCVTKALIGQFFFEDSLIEEDLGSMSTSNVITTAKDRGIVKCIIKDDNGNDFELLIPSSHYPSYPHRIVFPQ